MTAALDPIDATIAGLAGLWSDAPTLPYERDGQQVPMAVHDGPPLHDLDAWRALLVGSSATFLPGGGQATEQVGWGGRRSAQVDVVSELRVWSGDADRGAVARLRAAALGARAELARLLQQDRELGGAVDWARMTRWSYDVEDTKATGQGFLIVVEFTVRADTTRFEEE